MKDRALEGRFQLWLELMGFGYACEMAGLEHQFGKDWEKKLHQRRGRENRERLQANMRMMRKISKVT